MKTAKFMPVIQTELVRQTGLNHFHQVNHKPEQARAKPVQQPRKVHWTWELYENQNIM